MSEDIGPSSPFHSLYPPRDCRWRQYSKTLIEELREKLSLRRARTLAVLAEHGDLADLQTLDTDSEGALDDTSTNVTNNTDKHPDDDCDTVDNFDDLESCSDTSSLTHLDLHFHHGAHKHGLCELDKMEASTDAFEARERECGRDLISQLHLEEFNYGDSQMINEDIYLDKHHSDAFTNEIPAKLSLQIEDEGVLNRTSESVRSRRRDRHLEKGDKQIESYDHQMSSPKSEPSLSGKSELNQIISSTIQNCLPNDSDSTCSMSSSECDEKKYTDYMESGNTIVKTIASDENLTEHFKANCVIETDKSIDENEIALETFNNDIVDWSSSQGIDSKTLVRELLELAYQDDYLLKSMNPNSLLVLQPYIDEDIHHDSLSLRNVSCNSGYSTGASNDSCFSAHSRTAKPLDNEKLNRCLRVARVALNLKMNPSIAMGGKEGCAARMARDKAMEDFKKAVDELSLEDSGEQKHDNDKPLNGTSKTAQDNDVRTKSPKLLTSPPARKVNKEDNLCSLPPSGPLAKKDSPKARLKRQNTFVVGEDSTKQTVNNDESLCLHEEDASANSANKTHNKDHGADTPVANNALQETLPHISATYPAFEDDNILELLDMDTHENNGDNQAHNLTPNQTDQVERNLDSVSQATNSVTKNTLERTQLDIALDEIFRDDILESTSSEDASERITVEDITVHVSTPSVDQQTIIGEKDGDLACKLSDDDKTLQNNTENFKTGNQEFHAKSIETNTHALKGSFSKDSLPSKPHSPTSPRSKSEQSASTNPHYDSDFDSEIEEVINPSTCSSTSSLREKPPILITECCRANSEIATSLEETVLEDATSDEVHTIIPNATLDGNTTQTHLLNTDNNTENPNVGNSFHDGECQTKLPKQNDIGTQLETFPISQKSVTEESWLHEETNQQETCMISDHQLAEQNDEDSGSKAMHSSPNPEQATCSYSSGQCKTINPEAESPSSPQVTSKILTKIDNVPRDEIIEDVSPSSILRTKQKEDVDNQLRNLSKISMENRKSRSPKRFHYPDEASEDMNDSKNSNMYKERRVKNPEVMRDEISADAHYDAPQTKEDSETIYANERSSNRLRNGREPNKTSKTMNLDDDVDLKSRSDTSQTQVFDSPGLCLSPPPTNSGTSQTSTSGIYVLEHGDDTELSERTPFNCDVIHTWPQTNDFMVDRTYGKYKKTEAAENEPEAFDYGTDMSAKTPQNSPTNFKFCPQLMCQQELFVKQVEEVVKKITRPPCIPQFIHLQEDECISKPKCQMRATDLKGHIFGNYGESRRNNPIEGHWLNKSSTHVEVYRNEAHTNDTANEVSQNVTLTSTANNSESKQVDPSFELKIKNTDHTKRMGQTQHVENPEKIKEIQNLQTIESLKNRIKYFENLLNNQHQERLCHGFDGCSQSIANNGGLVSMGRNIFENKPTMYTCVCHNKDASQAVHERAIGSDNIPFIYVQQANPCCGPNYPQPLSEKVDAQTSCSIASGDCRTDRRIPPEHLPNSLDENKLLHQSVSDTQAKLERLEGCLLGILSALQNNVKLADDMFGVLKATNDRLALGERGSQRDTDTLAALKEQVKELQKSAQIQQVTLEEGFRASGHNAVQAMKEEMELLMSRLNDRLTHVTQDAFEQGWLQVQKTMESRISEVEHILTAKHNEILSNINTKLNKSESEEEYTKANKKDSETMKLRIIELTSQRDAERVYHKITRESLRGLERDHDRLRHEFVMATSRRPRQQLSSGRSGGHRFAYTLGHDTDSWPRNTEDYMEELHRLSVRQHPLNARITGHSVHESTHKDKSSEKTPADINSPAPKSRSSARRPTWSTNRRLHFKEDNDHNVSTDRNDSNTASTPEINTGNEYDSKLGQASTTIERSTLPVELDNGNSLDYEKQIDTTDSHVKTHVYIDNELESDHENIDFDF